MWLKMLSYRRGCMQCRRHDNSKLGWVEKNNLWDRRSRDIDCMRSD